IWAVYDTPHSRDVTLERNGLLICLRIPNPCCGVERCCHHVPTVWAESDSVHLGVMSEHRHLVMRPGVPNSHGPVSRRGRDPPAIWAEGSARPRVLVPPEDGHLLMRLGVPHPCRKIGRCSQHMPAIRAKRSAKYCLVVSCQQADLLTRLGVPN